MNAATIRTVFATSLAPREQWQATLLEHSFRRSGQQGELVRLVAGGRAATLPGHRTARVVPTRPWNPHPWVADDFAAYNTPAAVMEWLHREPVAGPILLLEPECALVAPVTAEVEPGRALATPWSGLPTGTGGPFGLDEFYAPLRRYCVDLELELPAVCLPVLIHSVDLARLAPRWLELMALIRVECPLATGKPALADRLAYAIAAAERRVHHEPAPLGVDTGGDPDETAVIGYRRPVESQRGDIVWDPHTYQPWQRVAPGDAAPGAGRRLLEVLADWISVHEAGGEVALLRPLRAAGVRDGKVLDQVVLEIPGQHDTVTLNASAAAIWELIDDQRTLAEIVAALAERFEVDLASLRDDVESTVDQLSDAGALRLEPASA